MVIEQVASKLYTDFIMGVEKSRNQKSLPCLKGGGPPKVVEGYERGI